MSDDTPREERFPGNSITTPRSPARRPEEKKVEKVTKGRVQTKKKSLGEKFSETFLAVDFGSVVEHIFFDVLVPAAKDTLDDIVSGSIKMILFGDRRGSRSGSRRIGTYTSYDRYYEDRGRSRDRGRDDRDRDRERRPTSRSPVEELIFDSKMDAEDVRYGLFHLIDEYGVASVKDLYALADVRTDYTKDKYGWFELNTDNTTISRIREGWLLELPRPIVID